MKFLFTDLILDGELAKIIVMVFLHSLWQGLLIAVMAWLLLRVTKFSPAIRYAMLVGFLFAFIGCIIITFLDQVYVNESPAATQTALPSGIAIEAGGFLQPVLDWCRGNANLIMIGWLFFFMFKVTQLVRGLIAVEKLRKIGVRRSNTQWMQIINGLKAMLGIKKSIALHESGIVQQPLVIGFLKPVILVPIGFFNNLKPQEVEAILLHELAHIKRNDYFVNLFQNLLESIFFFNPFVYWLSDMIRDEREVCCDALAIKHRPDKKVLLEALLSFHEKAISSTYAMSIMGSKTLLMKRVDRIVNAKDTKNPMMEKLTLLISFSILFVCLVSFSFMNKRNDNEKAEQLLLKDEYSFAAKPIDTLPGKNVSKEFKDGYEAGRQYKSGQPAITDEKRKQIEQKHVDEFSKIGAQKKVSPASEKKTQTKVNPADEFIAVVQEPADEVAKEKKRAETELVKSPIETIIQQPNGAVTWTRSQADDARNKKRIEQALIAEKKN